MTWTEEATPTDEASQGRRRWRREQRVPFAPGVSWVEGLGRLVEESWGGDRAYDAGTETAQPLFSQMNRAGSFQTDARFNEP